jgi:hypothetical protein
MPGNLKTGYGAGVLNAARKPCSRRVQRLAVAPIAAEQASFPNESPVCAN